MKFWENFYAILGKKRKNSGAISRLFNDEGRKIAEKFAIMEIVDRF
jgi:hypothetical protein